MNTAFVSGGASGIGAAIARLLSKRDWSVVIGDVDVRLGTSVATEIGGSFLPLDVGRVEAWLEVPPVEVAFLNAGIMSGPLPASPDTWTDDVWTRIRSVNVDGVVFGLRSVLSPMVAAGHGSVMITSSLSGVSPLPHDPLYAATKHFVIGLVRSTAAQLGESGVRINALCPGSTDTTIIPAHLRSQVPLMSAEAVAEVAVSVALDATGTGEAWVVPNERIAGFPWQFADIPSEMRPGAQPGVV